MRQPLRLRACCAKLVTLSDHMEHSSRGDLQLLYPAVSSKLPELSQKCHPSARGSTRSLLRTLCIVFTFVGFLHWIKQNVGLDEQRLITKSFAGCFLLPWRVVANLSRWWTYFGHCIDFDETRGEFTFSWNLWNWFRSWTRGWIRFSTKIFFSARDSIQYTCNVKIWFIYLLFSETIF